MIRKTLYYNEYESPIFWGSQNGDNTKVRAYFKLQLVFDLREGLRFVASVPNVSHCCRNPFKAICRVLEHESIGMAKYDRLKSRVRKLNLAKKL